jgi:hypothetical protein
MGMTTRTGRVLVHWLACFVLASCSGLLAMTPQTDTDEILEGRISQKDLSRYSWFENTKQEYTPDDSVVQALLPYSPELHFVVVLGTWCSDSRKHVPAFFSLMAALHIRDKHIELIGVDREKRGGNVNLAPLRIEYVPTIIVFYKGKEVGRIVEVPKVSLEKDLLQMLQSG